MFARGSGIDRRAAFWAERLHTRIAGIRRGLQIGGRLTGHSESRARDRNRDAKCRAGAGLTIGAMADRRLLRVGLTLDGDEPAMATAVDFHDTLPLAPSAARS